MHIKNANIRLFLILGKYFLTQYFIILWVLTPSSVVRRNR